MVQHHLQYSTSAFALPCNLPDGPHACFEQRLVASKPINDSAVTRHASASDQAKYSNKYIQINNGSTSQVADLVGSGDYSAT